MSSVIQTRRIAVLIPCLNEEATIAVVVRDVRSLLPEAIVYVYDNNSTDATSKRAQSAGAVVHYELLQGKGNVVRRMFADIEADIYVLIDGDGAHNVADMPKMIKKLIDDQLDMVSGVRVPQDKNAYRKGHRFGNTLLTFIVGLFFGSAFKDVLSGYRVFSRRFVKSFPVLSTGFEIETELAIHALEMRMRVAEVETVVKKRVKGSKSKLHTYKDGLRILRTIFMLVKEERPLLFFAILGVVLGIASIILALPVVFFFLETGTVQRLPTLLLSMGLMLMGFLSFTSGMILGTVTRGRREMKRLFFLAHPGPHEKGQSVVVKE